MCRPRTVTWDGAVITIPLNNRITFIDDDGILHDIRTFGQIYSFVPEPSSLVLMGCGVIGVVGYVIRRKRRGLFSLQ